MLAVRRLLFPTDFTDGAANAFPQAVYLADWHDAELHIVNVTGSSGEAERALPASTDTLGTWLGRSSALAEKLEALTIVQRQVESESPPERLVAYAEDQNIDLVVMGTHGRRGVRRMLLGSVTEEVVRRAPCPVFTVQADADEVPSEAVRRILVPVDFSEASESAVQHATEVAQTYGAEVHLLHVVEEVVYPSAYGVEPALFSSDEVVARVEKTLGEMAREDMGYENVQASATIGYAPMTILDYVQENEIDLVVIATHGRAGLDRMLLGSVAERVIRQSPVPVFVVKPDRKSLVPVEKKEAAAARG
jgi:nucleotide-binding universal stress UspA family protein